MSHTLSHDDKVKLVQFELQEASWIHNDVIRPHLYKWVDWIIIQVVEHKKFGMIGRLFHFCVEYFYIRSFLKIRIKRSRDTSFLGGKGFRQGTQKARLNKIRSIVLKRNKEIANREFPIGIIY